MNAGFRNPKPGQRKKPLKANQDGPSTLDRILDQPCQFTVNLICQLIIPTETVGSSSRKASLTLITRGGGHQAIKTTDWLASRTPGARNSFPPSFDYSRNVNSSPYSATHVLYWQSLHHAHITTHSRYIGNQRKHNTDNPTSIPVTFLIYFSFFLYHP